MWSGCWGGRMRSLCGSKGEGGREGGKEGAGRFFGLFWKGCHVRWVKEGKGKKENQVKIGIQTGD
jgi:hypothetical protein